MLFEIDDQQNISIARGYGVTIPITIQKADSSYYDMLPTDVLTFTVRNSVQSATNIFQITSNTPFITLPSSATANVNYGNYKYDLTLTHEGWIETIATAKNFVIGGDDNALIDSYRKLLTSEYRHSPKLINWLLWLLNEGTTYTTFIKLLVEAFDLDVAEGQQLDTIGRMVGVKRLLEFVPVGGESPLLGDDTYRMLIKATIIKNTWKGKLEDLYSAWRTVFPNTKLFQIQDLQDMTFNVVIAGAFTSLERELIAKGYIIPKPEGVRINLLTITDTTGLPLFAYDLDTLQFSGYTSYWAEPE
jgi:hypothetical protein